VVDVLAEDSAVVETAFAHEDAAFGPLAAALAGRRRGGLDEGGGARGLSWQKPEVSPRPCDPAALVAALAASLGAAPEVVERLGVAAYVSVPLAARGRALGAMTLVSARPERAAGPAELALAADLAQRAALAVDNARLYGEAQRAVRLRDEFLSIASHELRTPLSALELQVQSMRVQLGREPVDLDRLKAKSDVVERQVVRLARLISEMLDVARLEAGRLELELEEVDLGGLVREVAARFADELERAGCTLALEVEDEVVGQWDRPRLDQVVANLLQNAIKYGQGQPIRIWLRREIAAAILGVADRGIGIPVADQRRIFERFERAVSSRKYGGMGVGLFIVDQVLTAHGGRVEVRSLPGEGATFEVRLPL
jgi:signal transduction histidine kinase